MPTCPSCRRKTARTEDQTCQWCGSTLLSSTYRQVTKTYRNFDDKKSITSIPQQLELKSPVKTELRQPVSPSTSSYALKTSLLFLTYLFAFIVIEVISYYVSFTSGIILNFTILFILIINSTTATIESQSGLLLALGLVPLIRIASLVVPVAEISHVFWYLVISIPVFAGIYNVMHRLNLSFCDVGFNGKKKLVQLLVAATGIGLSVINYIILKPDSLVIESSIHLILLPALILIIVTGFVEELAFRGVMQRIARSVGSWGWIYIAMVYAVSQIGYGIALHVLFTFIVGLFYGWVVKKTGSIIGVSISHGLINVGMYLILPHTGI